jgi:hypothetical protein
VSADVSIEAHVRALEEELLQPAVRKTVSRVHALLADDFMEFGSSGRVFDKHDIIDSLKSEFPVRRALTDFRALPLGPGVVLTTYRATSYGVPGEATYPFPAKFGVAAVRWSLANGVSSGHSFREK